MFNTMWLVLSQALASDATAQQRFDSWTYDNQPQSVNDIVRTRDAYLWLATHGGLVRFGGVDAEVQPVATFYRISPERYPFTATRANPEGLGNPSEQSLDIVILPPFWRRWWFITIVGGMAASIILVHSLRLQNLRAKHKQQAAFSVQLLDFQENERRRLSNDMHDSIGQHVMVIKKRAMDAMEFLSGQERAHAEFREIAGLADQIRTEMKEIAYGLRPYQLDKIGLSKTIQNMVNKVSDACVLHIATEIAPIDDFFPDDSKIHVYRMVQEGVTNIVKHSQATHAKVTISRDAGRVQLRIEDNGRGFNSRIIDGVNFVGQGFGLMSIYERARFLGGKVEIRSESGTGTVITATFRMGDETHG